MEIVSCALRLREGIYKQFKPLKRGNWKGYPWLGNPHQHSQHRNHYWKPVLVLIESSQLLLHNFLESIWRFFSCLWDYLLLLITRLTNCIKGWRVPCTWSVTLVLRVTLLYGSQTEQSSDWKVPGCLHIKKTGPGLCFNVHKEWWAVLPEQLL